MKLTPSLIRAYTKEPYNARQAQHLAEFIAWGPVVFQVSRIMIKRGILDMIRESENGLTIKEIAQKAELSEYAVQTLMEASLCIGTVLLDSSTERFTISKTGWFLLQDRATRVNIEFNHHINYKGMFNLEDSLLEGVPKGLETLGNWQTIYEGLSQLPEQAKKSWFNFDHFYSDSSFPDALKVVFDTYHIKSLWDIGGNTGKWALECVKYNPDVKVTVLDLPQQIKLLKENIEGKYGCERIESVGINLLQENSEFPAGSADAIWMSQFLDCFSKEQITNILQRLRKTMGERSRIFIMEPLWDRQKYETAAFCLTMTSLYFTAMANGNSKMYTTQDLQDCIVAAGLKTEEIYDNLGQANSILVLKRA